MREAEENIPLSNFSFIDNFISINTDWPEIITQCLDYKDLIMLRQTNRFFYNNLKLQEIQKEKLSTTVLATVHNSFLIYKGNLFACGYYLLPKYKDLKTFTLMTIDLFKQSGGVKQVSAGPSHVLVLCENGVLFGAHMNNYGQLGLGDIYDTSTFVALNNQIFREAGGVKFVTTSPLHTFVLCNNGKVFSSGSNEFGSLGLGDKKDRSNFHLVNGQLFSEAGGVKEIAVSAYHTLVLCENGGVFSCGKLGFGYFESDKVQAINTFTAVDYPNTGKVKKIKCSWFYSVILTENGEIFGCGGNEQGPIYPEVDDDYEPSNVENKLKFTALNNPTFKEAGGVKDIAIGWNHILVLCNNGAILVWGGNKSGQLGLGHNDIQNTFVALNNEAFEKAGGIRTISAGDHFSLIHCYNGAVFACGSNSCGQLGLGHCDDQTEFTPCFKSFHELPWNVHKAESDVQNTISVDSNVKPW